MATRPSSALALRSNATRKRVSVADRDWSRSWWASEPRALAVSAWKGSPTGSQRAVTTDSCRKTFWTAKHAVRSDALVTVGWPDPLPEVEESDPAVLAAWSAVRAEDDAELEHAVGPASSATAAMVTAMRCGRLLGRAFTNGPPR